MAQIVVIGSNGSSVQNGLGEFILADFGTQDPSQGRYVGTQGFYDLMAKLATLQVGAAPVIRLALTTGPFVVPLAGMPATGWDFRGGWITSFYGTTGSVVLDCPPGVLLDNLFGIGGTMFGLGAVVLRIAPPPGTGVLNFSVLPPGAAWITTIGSGSAVDHSTSTGAYLRGPNANTTCVLVSANSQQNTGIVPPLTGPLLELGNTDGAVLAQFGTNGLPNGSLVGGGPGSTLLNIYDASANPNTDNIAVFAPGFTGGGGVIPFSFVYGQFVQYVAANPAFWAGPSPANVNATLERLAAAVSGLLGGPIP